MTSRERVVSARAFSMRVSFSPTLRNVSSSSPALAGDFVAVAGHRHHPVATQAAVVVDVLVTAGNAQHALSPHLHQRMFDATLVAVVDAAGGKAFAHSVLLVDFAQKLQPSVRGQMSAIEVGD
ncbi:MAG: hypothetical protein OXB95_04940 [Rhodobacteraceae bacterium]|nr:hypothetical protein [Paracoccaceae bacterium]